MKPINHALISNYHEGMKRKQLTPEDFRKLTIELLRTINWKFTQIVEMPMLSVFAKP
jgi:uracil phosphoribosyltransferase